MNLNLTFNDYKKIEAIEKKASKSANYQITLYDSIKEWGDLCMKIKQGYSDMFEEYTNSLGSRSFIKKAMSALSENGQKKLFNIVNPMDKIFINNTINIYKPIINYTHLSQDTDFWFFRIPIKISKEGINGFEEYLKDPTLNTKIVLF